MSLLSLGNLVLVSPQKTQGYQPILRDTDGTAYWDQPEAILFHYEAENTINLKSDITDHYVEDNTAINDHIGLAPEIITVNAYIGELTDIAEGPLKLLKNVTDKLLVISEYAPRLTVTALNTYNRVSSAYFTVKSMFNSAVSAWTSINGTAGTTVIGDEVTQYPNQTKQQIAFQQFYGYWRLRTLFTVQTPWAIFENCAIQSITATQSADTTEITGFEVTFKVMRFSSTSNIAKRSGRSSTQAAALMDLGSTSLT